MSCAFYSSWDITCYLSSLSQTPEVGGGGASFKSWNCGSPTVILLSSDFNVLKRQKSNNPLLTHHFVSNLHFWTFCILLVSSFFFFSNKMFLLMFCCCVLDKINKPGQIFGAALRDPAGETSRTYWRDRVQIWSLCPIPASYTPGSNRWQLKWLSPCHPQVRTRFVFCISGFGVEQVLAVAGIWGKWIT